MNADQSQDKLSDECCDMEVHILGADGQTTQKEAERQFLLLRHFLATGDLFGASQAGESAVASALATDDHDLAGWALVGLGCAYGRLRRYRRQEEVYGRFLELLPGMRSAQTVELCVRVGLGWAVLRRGDVSTALIYSQRAAASMAAQSDNGAAEKCRRLERAVRIRLGDLSRIPALLDETLEYLKGTPEDTLAWFRYWYDLAEFNLRSGQTEEAVLNGLEALHRAGSHTERQVEAYLLLYRCAVAREDWVDALSFALQARMVANAGKRYDLSHEALLLMAEVLRTRRAGLMEALGVRYSASGIDPYQFLPRVAESAAASWG